MACIAEAELEVGTPPIEGPGVREAVLMHSSTLPLCESSDSSPHRTGEQVVRGQVGHGFLVVITLGWVMFQDLQGVHKAAGDDSRENLAEVL